MYDGAVENGHPFAPPEYACDLERMRIELSIAIDANLSQADRTFLQEQELAFKGGCPLDLSDSTWSGI